MLLNSYNTSNINAVFMGSVAYLIILSFVMNSLGSKNPKTIKNNTLILLLMLAGLPPSPIFFTKVWLISILVKKIPVFLFLFIISINSALVFSYVSFCLMIKNIKYSKTCIGPYRCVHFLESVTFFIFFILNPIFFKVI